MKNTPKSFWQGLLLMSLIFYIVSTLELQIKQHLLGLAFVWFWLNHWKNVSEAFWNLDIASCMSASTKKGVLLFAWLSKSTSFTIFSKSYKICGIKHVPKLILKVPNTKYWVNLHSVKYNDQISFKGALILVLVY